MGRAATEEEKKKDTVTYKDLDFRERLMRIQIGPQKRVALLEQLQRDCKVCHTKRGEGERGGRCEMEGEERRGEERRGWRRGGKGRKGGKERE